MIYKIEKFVHDFVNEYIVYAPKHINWFYLSLMCNIGMYIN